jgi:hypothetical protein
MLFIRFLSKKEIYKFQNLIKKNWKKQISRLNSSDLYDVRRRFWLKEDHIYTKNKKLILFYYNYHNKKTTTILGLFINSKLGAVLGLMNNKNWDNKLGDDIYVTLLLKSNLAKDAIFKFFKYIFENLKPNFLCCTGFNKIPSKFYEQLGKIGFFEHYYIFNAQTKKRISTHLIEKKVIKKINLAKLEMKIEKKIKVFPNTNFYPKKTKKYFTNKYLNNPYYDYFLMSFYNNKKIKFFFICRNICIGKTKISRIVDFYGKITFKDNILGLVKKYLYENQLEYIDFLCSGFDQNLLINLGFNKKEKKQIIPNYFEPFIKKNINVNLCIMINKYKKNKTVIFKGDGDQDRINIIK